MTTEVPKLYLSEGQEAEKQEWDRVITFHLKNDWGSNKGTSTKDLILIIEREKLIDKLDIQAIWGETNYTILRA